MIETIIYIGSFLLIQSIAAFFWVGKWMGRADTKAAYMCRNLDLLNNHITDVRKEVGKVHERLDEHGQRISRIEGQLNDS